MVEAIGMEVFGTASLSTFEYICAYAFIFYPLVSLPLLVYYWLKASEKNPDNSLIGFEIPFALKNKQEIPFVSPLKTSEVPETTEIPDVPQNTSEVISSTGRHNITFIGRRSKRAEKKSVTEHSGSKTLRSDSNMLRLVEPVHLTEAVRDKSDDSENLLSAAKKVALSSESTAELRAAALDFLISSQSRDRFCKQKTSFHEVSSDFESSASSF